MAVVVVCQNNLCSNKTSDVSGMCHWHRGNTYQGRGTTGSILSPQVPSATPAQAAPEPSTIPDSSVPKEGIVDSILDKVSRHANKTDIRDVPLSREEKSELGTSVRYADELDKWQLRKLLEMRGLR